MNNPLLFLLALATATTTAMPQDCCTPPPRDAAPRRLDIEFLYLDLTECARCTDTAAGLTGAIGLLDPVLRETGFEVRLRRVHVTTEQQAREARFASSPTVRIDGRDVALESRESPCTDCGGLCKDSGPVSCREWRYRGRWHTSPPRALFVEAILGAMARAAAAPASTSALVPAPAAAPARSSPPCCGDSGPPADSVPPFELPENLRRFFATRRTRPAGSDDRQAWNAGSGCCAPAAPATSGACCAPGAGCCGN